MNIFKTFETLLSEPLSIIKKRVIRVIHVETNIFANQMPVSVDFDNKSTQITVYNNKKMYNLLSSVVHKQKKAQKNGNKRKIHH